MGYWRNWERQISWLARRIAYIMITGNAYVDKANKPQSEDNLWSLSTDSDKPKIKKRKITKKEIDILKQMVNESLELNSKSQG